MILKKIILLLLLMNIILFAETDQLSTLPLSLVVQTEHINVETNATVSKIPETVPESESAFQKASLPMKVAIIVGVPIVAAGAVVYYAVLTPFALVRWAFESKN